MRVRAVIAAFAALAPACASAPAPFDTTAEGFAIYRSGRLSRGELRALCAEGVREIVVLDGTARRRECRWRNEVCPGLRVRWDEAQDPDRPVDAAFLRAFDAWVEEARREGKRIAFRCWQGWHRAGRLAAYYRIRFDGWTAEAAIREMHRRGRMMAAHPGLDPQVRALADFAAGRPCSVDRRYCVAGDAPAEASFPEDACPADLRPSSSGQ